MGNLFGVLLGTDSEAALDVFLTLRRSANQREALRAAAKFKLAGTQLQFFGALVDLYGSLERERNCLAHGCFGVADNDHSVLLWIDVRDHVHFQTEVLARLARGESVPDPHVRLKEAMYVHRIADLEALQNDMEQFWKAAQIFNSCLRNRTGPESAEFMAAQRLPLINAKLTELAKNPSAA